MCHFAEIFSTDSNIFHSFEISFQIIHFANPFFYFSAGAMRLPGGVDDPNKPHFLANGYITQFGLTIKPFPNSDPNTLTHIYGYPTTVTSGMYPLLLFET